jgi:hypothetical protein
MQKSKFRHPMKPLVFYHLYIKDQLFTLWIDEQLNILKSSGLANNAIIYICITTPAKLKDTVEAYISQFSSFINILDIRSTDEPTIYEGSTLKYLYKYSFSHDAPILYFHSKGSSLIMKDKKHFPNRKIYDWRNLMQYFCIVKYRDCLNLLGENDVVGVNWRYFPHLHFSGNFWWARSEYIRTLPDPLDLENFVRFDRYSMEFWLGFGSPTHHCLHNSGIDHWRKEYPSNLYV